MGLLLIAKVINRLCGAEYYAVDTLRNLKLFANVLNRSVSNEIFTKERKKFAKYTGILMNKWFANHEL